MLPLRSEHVDDVGEEHQTDDGEEHQYQDVQHDVCVSVEQRLQKMLSHPSRCLHEKGRMDCGDPSPHHFYTDAAGSGTRGGRSNYSAVRLR